MKRRVTGLIVALLSGLAAVLVLSLTLSQPVRVVASFGIGQEASAQRYSSIARYVAVTGTDNGDCSTPAVACRTVQYAVDVAGEGDVIKIASGIYTDIHLRAGALHVVCISKTITVRGGYTTTNGFADPPAPALYPTVLDAQGQGRVLLITGPFSVTIEGLSITGGNSAGLTCGLDGYYGGGGICVSGDTVTIRLSQVYSNTTGDGPAFGGGLFVAHSDAISLIHNTIYSNTATGDYSCGGGVFIRASKHVTAVGNIISGNRGAMGEDAGACGGGIVIGDEACISAVIRDNVISENQAAGPWGGIGIQCANVTIEGNAIISNTAGHYGGGLSIREGQDVTVANNLIIGNHAGDGCEGGGVLIENSRNVDLVNNIVADNQLTDGGTGAGIYVNRSQCNFRHTTLARNGGGDGSGIYVTGDSHQYSSVALTNTILVSHTVGITLAGGNTATLNGVLWYSNAMGNIVGEGTIIVTNAYTGNPAFLNPDGGDYHILLGSAAIDKGVIGETTEDIDGDPRPLDAAPDLGADERSTGCFARLNDGNIYTTLQSAVDASTHPTDVIKVAGRCADMHNRLAPPGYDGSPVITQVAYISRTIAIQGGYTTTNWSNPYPLTQPTTIDAAGQGRAFFIIGGISPSIRGLNIIRGDAGPNGCGGGIYVLTATATLRDNLVMSNTATAGGGLCLEYASAVLDGNVFSANTVWAVTGSEGGGLFSWFSHAELVSNTFRGNVAHGGGGLWVQASDVVLVRNVVISNSAVEGGGLYVTESDAVINSNSFTENNASLLGGGVWLTGDDRDVAFDKNIVMFNTGGSGGGGLYLYHSNAKLRNNAISSNSAERGGGAYLEDSAPVFVNTIIAENRADIEGSGLYVTGSRWVRLLHTTVARNKDGDGSGIYAADGSTIALTNTIVASQTIGIYVSDDSTATLEGTLWGAGPWANESDWSGSGIIITGTVVLWGNPAFLNPDEGDYHILLGSAAIDKGIDTKVGDDIDGDPRPIGTAPDIGADEVRQRMICLPLVLRKYP